jgi:hypothetical protein
MKSSDASNFIINRTETHSRKSGYAYTYEFPHTCDKTCTRWVLCPHHFCTISCKSDCQRFVCDKRTSVRIFGLPSQLLTHAKIYEVAEKYDVIGLKDLSRGNFKSGCEVFWNDDAFPIAISYAFSTTVPEDAGLREMVIDTIAAHMELVHKPEIQALVAEFSDLAIGILLKKAGGGEPANKKRKV